MEFFRNPEIKKNIFIYFIINIVAVCIGLILGFSYFVLTVFLCIVFDIAHLISTYSRYKKISDFSFEIGRILHGQETLNFEEYSEGELAVLHSEIYKMTIRMREQADNLQHDKVYLSDSIADISHQIKTPLTSINLIVSFLSKADLNEERRLELTKELAKLLSRIDWLISSLLKMSKLDAKTANIKSECVSVKKLLEKAAQPFAIGLELREQQLNIEVNENDAFTGDFSWTVEAIGNIIKNCMEHTPEGGKIDIKAAENAIFTEIIITDNGCGIDKTDLPHLFERFYKGKNSGDQSVGIGLALSRMIITAQNGTVKAENNKDSGAKFTIRFYKGAV